MLYNISQTHKQFGRCWIGSIPDGSTLEEVIQVENSPPAPTQTIVIENQAVDDKLLSLEEDMQKERKRKRPAAQQEEEERVVNVWSHALYRLDTLF